MVNKRTIIILATVILLLNSCKDFPLPYDEKDKNFSPTAKIYFPENNKIIPYQDSILFVIVANDIEDKATGLKINLSSNIDGEIYSGSSDKYGQIAFYARLKSYSVHTITLNVSDNNGNTSSDQIILYYNFPGSTNIVSSSFLSGNIRLTWNKSIVPLNNFSRYEVYRSEGPDSTRFERIAIFTAINDTTYEDVSFYLGQSYYKVHSIDKNGNTTKSELRTIGPQQEMYSFPGFSFVRRLLVSEKHNLLFVHGGYYAYDQPYYQQLVIVDLNDFTIKRTVDLRDNLWNDFYLSENEDLIYLGVGLNLKVYDINQNIFIDEFLLEEWPRRITKINDYEFLYSGNYGYSGGEYIHYLNIATNTKSQINRGPDSYDHFSEPTFTFNNDLNLLYVFDSPYHYMFEKSDTLFTQVLRESDYNDDQPFLGNDNKELYRGNNAFSAVDMQLITTFEDRVYNVINDGKYLVTNSYLISASNHQTKYLYPRGRFSTNAAFIRNSNKLLLFEGEKDELYVIDMSELQ